MVMPLLYFAFLWLTFGFHILLSWLHRCLDPPSKWKSSVRAPFSSPCLLLHTLETHTRAHAQRNKFRMFLGRVMSWSRVEFYLRTTCVLMLTAYQGLVETVLLVFSCKEIGNTSVLLLIPSVECSSSNSSYQSLRIVVFSPSPPPLPRPLVVHRA